MAKNVAPLASLMMIIALLVAVGARTQAAGPGAADWPLRQIWLDEAAGADGRAINLASQRGAQPPGGIQLAPTNRPGRADAVQASKTVSPMTALAGDTVTYTLTITSNDALARTVALTDVLPDGLTYVPGSVSAGGTYDAGSDAILINYQFTPVKTGNYTYEDDLTTPGLGAQSPFGGFLDLASPPYSLAVTPLSDNIAGSFDTLCTVDFYDITGGTPTRLGFSTNGLFLPRGTNGTTNPASAITTTLPSTITPNRFIAGLWGDFSIAQTNGFTQTGYTAASAGSTCADKIFIIQLTNMHTKTDSNPARNALTMQLVYSFAAPDVYWVLYDNVRGPLAGTVMGLEDATGTVGLQYVYNGSPASHAPHTGQVIKYSRLYQAPAPLTVTFRATVDANAPREIVNTAAYTAQGDPTPRSVSATLINASVPPPTATATATATSTATQTATATSTATQTATATATSAATQTATATATSAATQTATQTATATATSAVPTATTVPPRHALYLPAIVR